MPELPPVGGRKPSFIPERRNVLAAAAPAANISPPPPPRMLPELYPGIEPAALYQFLDEAQFEYIKALRIVRIAPLFDGLSTGVEKRFGIGLTHLLIRDLRLSRELSMPGPEDTGTAVSLLERDSAALQGSILISGSARLYKTGYSAIFSIRAEEGTAELEVESPDLPEFIGRCAEELLRNLGLSVNPTLREQWKHGRPDSRDDLIALGRLDEMAWEAANNVTQKLSSELLRMFRAKPGFPLVLHTRLFEASWEDCLTAFEHDPYDVQIAFYLHNRLWSRPEKRTGSGMPEAFQFLRRAIELSPGHGKAHMCALLSASPDADVRLHSELGYRLLPGNGFAIANYLSYLNRKKIIPEDLSIAFEGPRNDPENPSVYWAALALLKRAARFADALPLAEKLERLHTPPMSSRTRYCLSQNPRYYEQIKSGKVNPLADAQSEIRKLRQLIVEGGGGADVKGD